MSAIFTAVILVSGIATTASARADTVVSGYPCIVDSNTLQIGGRVVDGLCTGGIEVRLFGSKAPEKGDTCEDRSGKPFSCGEEAVRQLSKIIRRRHIECYHVHGAFDEVTPLVTCLSGRYDVAAEMVLSGAAKVSDLSKRYNMEQAGAKRGKRGLWR